MRISRGSIEILSEVHLIEEGERVGTSEAALLSMLNIEPFTYGLVVLQVYDNGVIFSPTALDITPEKLSDRFAEGVRNVVSLSLAIDHPTLVSAPYFIAQGYENLLGMAAATDTTFEDTNALFGNDGESSSDTGFGLFD
ncbi:hypothetical protein QR680_006193 [Steinernema hermaphroditum]|uniref:Large ribosomal subunit protein uL10 n=1 Tax=Steinernema hermaphroditum TaxID=289476 RepID=A0AA39HX18_9BILA|nr:hypothetical protein QR680_006193 [Steinernema hermaphroditum]